MSDTWYRDPPDLPPPYEMNGDLWTWDGHCLNPIHGCDPPAWYHEMAWVDLQATVVMGLEEAYVRTILGIRPS